MAEMGKYMTIVAISMTGKITPMGCQMVTESIINKIGMEKIHHWVQYDYPVDGKGGKGFTCIQPITQSFIAFDVWPDLNGGYLVICSCKAIDLEDIASVLKDCDLHVEQKISYRMGI